jgi:hypothetical protein
MTAEIVIAAVVIAFAVVGYFIWDRGYRGSKDKDEALQPTAEVFKDPTTGKLMRVYEDPRTGQRQYRDEPKG